jgi:hypothetical protein
MSHIAHRIIVVRTAVLQIKLPSSCPKYSTCKHTTYLQSNMVETLHNDGIRVNDVASSAYIIITKIAAPIVKKCLSKNCKGNKNQAGNPSTQSRSRP